LTDSAQPAFADQLLNCYF